MRKDENTVVSSEEEIHPRVLRAVADIGVRLLPVVFEKWWRWGECSW